MPQWTDNQRKAIYDRGGSMLLGAGAGSGKTTVLVERIFTLISDADNHIDADRLLVVTFTVAAAAEMRVRLKRRIADALSVNPHDENLLRQSQLIERARISTVDSFCSSLLREFFAYLDIPADYGIADDFTAQDMREQALERTLDALYGGDVGFKAFASMLGRSRSDGDAGENVIRCHDFLSQLADPGEFIKNALAELDNPTLVPQSLLRYARASAKSVKAKINSAMKSAQLDEKLSKAYLPALSDDADLCDALVEKLESNGIDGAAALLNACQKSRLGSYRGEDKGLAGHVKALRDAAWNGIESIKKTLPLGVSAQIDCDALSQREQVAALFNAALKYSDILFKIKLKQKKLEYIDLERLAIRLLEENPDVRDEVASRFDRLFVDEYQDTNELQQRIYDLIIGDRQCFFAVGDIKQSIYSFRRADPNIFINARQKSNPADSGLYPCFVPLSDNYRSSKPVIDAVNRVFDPIMRLETGGVDYDENERLRTSDTTAGTAAEIMVITQGKNRYEEEASAVANRIRFLLDSGAPVSERGETRRCRPGDFCIILRSARDSALIFASALQAAGVQSWSSSSDSFFDSSEITTLIALLKAIDDPADSISLAAVMMSPLVGFTPDDMLRLRSGARSKERLFSLVRRDKSDKSVGFVEMLNRFRSYSLSMPVDELISRIADETAAEILLCAGPELRRRRDNIRSLIEYAAAVKNADGGLARFLRLCDRASENGKNLKGSTAPPDNAVSVITVHGSKGLEWPFVFVCDINRQFNRQDYTQPSVLFDTKLGIGMNYRTDNDGVLEYKKTIQSIAIANEISRRGKSEEMRVLYVALTRAKQRLFLTCESKNTEKLLVSAQQTAETREPADALDVNSYAGWILPAFVGDRADLIFNSLAQNKEYECNNAIFVPVGTQSTVAVEKDVMPFDDAEWNRLKAIIKSERDRRLSDVPVKLTVSELAEGDASFVNPPAFTRQGGLSAAEIGTALHLFLQCADYASARESLDGEIKRLVDNHFISSEAAQAMDREKLRVFLAGPLAERMIERGTIREYEFLDELPANDVMRDGVDYGDEKVLIQGIADCLIPESDGYVLVDYKSDRVADPQKLIDRYSEQLRLYRNAIEKRTGKPVKQCIIYSLHLGREIVLPL